MQQCNLYCTKTFLFLISYQFIVDRLRNIVRKVNIHCFEGLKMTMLYFQIFLVHSVTYWVLVLHTGFSSFSSVKSTRTIWRSTASEWVAKKLFSRFCYFKRVLKVETQVHWKMFNSIIDMREQKENFELIPEWSCVWDWEYPKTIHEEVVWMSKFGWHTAMLSDKLLSYK